jgi:hypothetical protein
MFGCECMSYGLILLRFCICVSMSMATESVLRSVYYSSLFLFFVDLLVILLFCTFSRINLFFREQSYSHCFYYFGAGLSAGYLFAYLYFVIFSFFVGSMIWLALCLSWVVMCYYVFSCLRYLFGGGVVWVSVRLVSGFSVCLICICQTDLKVTDCLLFCCSHTMSYWGFCGSFTLMTAHGLCSSGLFCLSNIS